jgi:hypothetical protein
MRRRVLGPKFIMKCLILFSDIDVLFCHCVGPALPAWPAGQKAHAAQPHSLIEVKDLATATSNFPVEPKIQAGTAESPAASHEGARTVLSQRVERLLPYRAEECSISPPTSSAIPSSCAGG